MSAELVIHGARSNRFRLGEEPVVLGRGSDCDLVLEHGTVSRRHCRLTPDSDGSWRIEDLGSRYGTRIDGEPIVESTLLPPGAFIEIGDLALRLATPEGLEPSLSGDAQRDHRLLGQLVGALGDFAAAEDLDPLLRAIVDRGIRIAGGERGALFLATEDGALEVVFARDLDSGDLALDQVLTRSLPSQAVRDRSPVVIPDAGSIEVGGDLPPSLSQSRRRSVICIPIPNGEGVRGVLYVDSPEPAEKVGPAELSLLTVLAAEAGAALARSDERGLEAAERRRLAAENEALRTRLGHEEPIADCEAMRRTLEILRKVAPSSATICLSGETGTGKEVMARYLHRSSDRARGPFVVVDCGALPESLIESELFGHEQGAFTGAARSRQGRLREAEGGTVFLDEIGEVPLALQPRLLRFLQEQEVRPVGGQPISLDVRVVCATHRDLEALVSAGDFREDLFYRLAVLKVDIPPLRERGEDILLLAEHLLGRLQPEEGPRVRGFSREAVAALLEHPWPGNVRELEHRIQRAVLLAATPFITRFDLALGPEDPEEISASESTLELEPLKEARATASARFEKAYVERALAAAGGSVAEAARLAGVSRQALHTYIKRYAIDRLRFRDRER